MMFESLDKGKVYGLIGTLIVADRQASHHP